MNLPTADKIKQTGATCLEKLVQWNHNKIFDSVTFAIIHHVAITLRLKREQIRQILLDLEQLTSDTSFTSEKLFLKRAERDFRVARRPC